MTPPARLTIDIVSDLVCPWCAIGYKGLEQALARLADRVEPVIAWHPFELAPHLPPEGQSLDAFGIERHRLTPAQQRDGYARVIEIARPLGLVMRHTPDSRIYNTLKGHQLVRWAGTQRRATAMTLRLFQAYFTDQQNIADDAVLLTAAADVGLDRAAAAAVLADARDAAEVRAEARSWASRDIRGVPAFILDGTYMLPGANSPDGFVDAIERVLAQRAVPAGDGAVCH